MCLRKPQFGLRLRHGPDRGRSGWFRTCLSPTTVPELSDFLQGKIRDAGNADSGFRSRCLKDVCCGVAAKRMKSAAKRPEDCVENAFRKSQKP